MKGRNPKAETRRPKTEGQRYRVRLSSAAAAGKSASCTKLVFGPRTSAFLRPSDFGLRVSASALCILGLALSLPAADLPLPDQIPPLRPPHGELPPTFWEQHTWLIVICGVVLLALVCAAAWLLTRRKPPVAVPPEVQARQALEPLRQTPEDGALLSRVSQILHHYLAAAFDLPPEELTTAELCRAIESHARIGPELSAAISQFLRLCDQDKFSPPSPTPPLRAVNQALKLVEQAQARLAGLAQAAESPGASLPRRAVEK